MVKFYIQGLMKFTAKQLGSIVYIGAGSGGRAAELCELNPKVLTAVEASCQLFKSLERKLKKYKFTNAHNGWVFPNNQTEGMVKFYNNPRFNSLKTSKELAYGNVKLKSEENAKGRSLNDVLSKSELCEEFLNFLVLDVAGADLLLQGLNENTELVKNLDFIFITQPLLSQDKQDINFFTCNEYIPLPVFGDTEYLLFQKNQSFLTNTKQKEIDELRVELANSKAHAEGVVEDAQQAKNALLVEMEEIRIELERVTQADEIKEKEAQEKIASITDELTSAQQKVNTLNGTIEQKEKKVQQLSGALEQLKKDSEQQITHLTKQISTAKELEQRSANTCDVTSKLNLKLQSDLDDLRQRYSEKIQNEEELTNLVNELYVKLKQASEFYHALELKHPEIASGSHE
ncbi:hypothetical protein MHM87_18505 [Alteromonas sp. Cnat3-28]|uniref:hypothetical protein n=1 Tax=Alteromonas sp. Cnat3-28 TaxID=2917729 RepID=UPI001EF4CE01|nr:hypothetical protein [Alteromonas sp. Cnat3-28]MCG7647566.1 hypothetical protein [Alteromonas sp. Cnat3-28]